MKKTMLFGGLAAAALAVPAIAQMANTPKVDGAKAHRMMAPQTRAEVETRIREQFDKLDANRDGFIESAEAEAARAAHREEAADRRFTKLDADGNGAISRAEFDAASEQRMERREARAEGKGRATRAHRFHRAAMMHHLPGMRFERADANNDGRVSLQEATAKPLERFDRMDANKDGTVTPEERHEARKSWREERRAKRS